MKVRKTFLTLTIVGFMALLFCLPGSVFAGPGPGPGTGPNNILDGVSVNGPHPDAFILAGWRDNGDNTGILEVFVWVGGRLFSGVWDDAHSENSMVTATEFDIIVLDNDEDYWTLPEAIATELFGKPEDTMVVVLEPKDVSDFNLNQNPIQDFIDFTGRNLILGYKHMLYLNARLSFLVPKK